MSRMAVQEEVPHSLASVKESLDKGVCLPSVYIFCKSLNPFLSQDYRHTLHPHMPPQQYDPDAFDSMAVMNSEIWNLGEGEDSQLSSADLLPNVSSRNSIGGFRGPDPLPNEREERVW